MTAKIGGYTSPRVPYNHVKRHIGDSWRCVPTNFRNNWRTPGKSSLVTIKKFIENVTTFSSRRSFFAKNFLLVWHFWDILPRACRDSWISVPTNFQVNVLSIKVDIVIWIYKFESRESQSRLENKTSYFKVIISCVS